MGSHGGGKKWKTTGGQGTGVDLWCWLRRVPAAGGGCPSIVTSRPPAHATVVGPGAGDQGGVDGGRDGRDDEDEATKHVLRDSMCQRAMADGSDGRSNHTSLPPSEFSAESAEHKSIGRPRHSNGVVCWEVETEYAPGIGLCDRIRIEFSAPGIGLCDRIRIRILAGS